MDFLKNFTKDKKTTIMGSVQILLMVLVALGVINQDESEGISQASTTIVEALGGPWTVVAGVGLSAIGSVFLLFADTRKKPPSE